MPGKEEWVLVWLGSQHKCVERTVRLEFPDYLFLMTMPKLIFFQRSIYGTPFLTIRHHIAWNRFYISKVHYLFAFTSQTNKSVLNWVLLILIEQIIILKTRNQDFPPSKIEYVITLLKWLVRVILYLLLVVYRSTFKVVLKIFRIWFCEKPF